MKQFTKLFLSAATVLTLSACGNTDEPLAADSSTSAAASSTSETATSSEILESSTTDTATSESTETEQTSSSEVVEEIASKESESNSLDELDSILNSFVDVLNQNTTEAGFGDIIIDFYRVDPKGTTPSYTVDLSPDLTAYSNLEIKSYVTMICETFVAAAEQVDEVPMLEYYIGGLKIGESGMSFFGDPYEVKFENLD